MRLDILAAVVLLGSVFGSTATAAPLMSDAPSAGEGLLIRVHGCHRDVERGYVPEFGRRAWHYHRGSRCRAIEVAPPPPAPGPGHDDCHRDVRRHYLPEYGGRVTHRHVGPRCRAEIFDEVRPGRPPSGGVCVDIGGAQFCVRP